MINRIVLSYFPLLIFSGKVDGHSSQALYKGQRGNKDAWEWNAVGWSGRPDGMHFRDYWTVSSAALCLGETRMTGVFVGWLKPHSCVSACAAMFMQAGLKCSLLTYGKFPPLSAPLVSLSLSKPCSLWPWILENNPEIGAFISRICKIYQVNTISHY